MAVAAVGGTLPLMDHVASGGYEMVGTFNGNPLAMAAARADADRGRHGNGHQPESRACAAYRRSVGISAAIEDFSLNGSVVTMPAPKAVSSSRRKRSATTAASSPSTMTR